MEDFRLIDSTFGGFISGKILDSAIIGVLCFVVVSIMKMPYPMLISVIVGVTNIIPFFGPFIGAVPCALLILMVNPMQCLYFIIFIPHPAEHVEKNAETAAKDSAGKDNQKQENSEPSDR